ncbi:MAG: HAD family hydrolase [Deltaproteobacteria bacterium]|nr:HAD family hydrolase [Deltaproteobacteria bacterium]
MNAAPDAIVFDLFGTLVFFDDERLPRALVDGRSVVMTVTDLPRILAEYAPGLETERFMACLREVGAELLEYKRRMGIEIPTAVRFEQALQRLGVEGAAAASAAAEMAEAHMESLAGAVVVPSGRGRLLERLGATYRLALVSNFDHGPTARRVLAQAGLDVHLESIVISAEQGIRKPSASIFRRACGELDLAPSRCLYVGDTFAEDVEGATAAGLASVWVTRDSSAAAPALAAVADVEELPAWLEARFSGPGGGR